MKVKNLRAKKPTSHAVHVLGMLLFLCIVVLGMYSQISKVRAATTTYTNGLTINQPGTYENLDVTNPSGFCVKITAPNVILKNSKIHDCNGFGIWVESTHDVQIIGNEVWNTVLNTCYPSCDGGWESALKVRSENQTDKLAYNILFEGNKVHDNLGEGIASRGSRVTIRNNTFYDNFSVNIYTNGDHTTIENNFVYCTGDTRFQRDGNRPSGIAQGDEVYSGWNPSHANNMKAINNIVTGCKFGFRYLGAEAGVEQAGLRDSTIAFNTFACTTNAAISIPHEPNQNDLTIHNNIIGSIETKIDNMTGVSSVGNISKDFACNNYSPDSFKLSAPQRAIGSFTTSSDYFGKSRVGTPDVGAIEYVESSAGGTTAQPTATHTVSPTPTMAGITCPPAGNTARGKARMNVTVNQPGNYKAWIQMKGKGDSANSIWLQLDNLYCVKVGDASGMPSGTWEWVDYTNGNTGAKIPSPLIAAGAHTITLIGNAAEPGVAVDRILLTKDTACVPASTGDACIGVVSSPTSTNSPTATNSPTVTNSPTASHTPIATNAPVKTSTPTVTPTATPSPIAATYTPMPYGIVTTAPTFQTTSLPEGKKNTEYLATIVATDSTPSDVLTMSVTGLSNDLSLKNCISKGSGFGGVVLTCTVSGTPKKQLYTSPRFTVRDTKGNSTTKLLRIIVK